jgi:hypothetical protein
MKAMIVGLSATLLLESCNAARAQTRPILSQLGGEQDNLLISEIEARNPGTLCSFTPADGHARLMSYGNEAVVDVGSVPILLSYHPNGPGHDDLFTSKAVKISGKLKRETLPDPYRTVSHHVIVKVESHGRAEPIEGSWTCQAGLLTVRTAH